MGSSPVTATTLADSTLERFLLEIVNYGPHQPLVVAFSGGPDSTALLAAAVRVAGAANVWAAHLDHGLDADSSRRAATAKLLVHTIGARWISQRARPPSKVPAGREAWARQLRYRFLERTRTRFEAPAVLTAHHRRDQAETVLLRILFGSGVRGLAGIRPWIGGVGRPWLGLPAEVVRRAVPNGVLPITDPTNADLTVPRNRIRHRLLPHLSASDGDLEETLAALAGQADDIHQMLRRIVAPRSGYEPAVSGKCASLALGHLGALPRSLWPTALSLIETPARLEDDPPASARHREIAELRRQMRHGGRVEVSLAGDRRWIGTNGRLTLQPRSRACAAFCHRGISLPGAIRLPGGALLTISAAEPEPWMTTGEPRRAALELPARVKVGVRNRHPGDRIRPLGCDYERKLKDVLIDARVPRDQRDRLPLLTVDDQPVWVPGVTIDHRYRIRGESPLWVAHWHSGGKTRDCEPYPPARRESCSVEAG